MSKKLVSCNSRDLEHCFLRTQFKEMRYVEYPTQFDNFCRDIIPGHHLLCLFLSFIVMPNMDKIFCSKWLSHRQVVFGTKCNKLMVFDVNTRQVDHIPSLSSSENSSPPEAECGIHAIEINPSKTLLATGGK